MIYGTAWKENDTERLVSMALEAGFRGIDTANQRKHYFEAGVGAALKKSGVPRGELFLQTKFTFRAGQDARLPYDPKAPIGKQVEQSYQSSLEHLGVEKVDSYVLHGPATRSGWSAMDREAWAAMEGLGVTLGISNVSLEQLHACCAEAKVQPSFVQNRCYAATGWDAQVRAFCRERSIRYQGFSLLTANPHVVQGAKVQALAKKLRATPAQVVFAWCMSVGMMVLSGTTDPKHMREDLEANSLSAEGGEGWGEGL